MFYSCAPAPSQSPRRRWWRWLASGWGAEGAPPLLCYVLEGGLPETPQKPGSESSYKYRQALLDGLHGATAGCMVPLTLGPCQGAGQR